MTSDEKFAAIEHNADSNPSHTTGPGPCEIVNAISLSMRDLISDDSSSDPTPHLITSLLSTSPFALLSATQ